MLPHPIPLQGMLADWICFQGPVSPGITTGWREGCYRWRGFIVSPQSLQGAITPVSYNWGHKQTFRWVSTVLQSCASDLSDPITWPWALTLHQLEGQQLTRPLQKLLIQNDRKVRCLGGLTSGWRERLWRMRYHRKKMTCESYTYCGKVTVNSESDFIAPELRKWGLERWNNFPNHPGYMCWSQVRIQSPWTLCSTFSPLIHEKPLLAGAILLENQLYYHAEGALSLSLSYIHCWDYRHTWLSDGLIAWTSQRSKDFAK